MASAASEQEESTSSISEGQVLIGEVGPLPVQISCDHDYMLSTCPGGRASGKRSTPDLAENLAQDQEGTIDEAANISMDLGSGQDCEYSEDGTPDAAAHEEAVQVKTFDLKPHVKGIVDPRCGFVEDAKAAAEVLDRYQRVTSTKFITFRTTRNFGNTDASERPHRILWSLQIGNQNVVPFDCVPFMLLGSKGLECEFGPDRNVKKKLAYAEKTKDDEDIKRRVLTQSTKKVNCGAQISLFEVLKFPEYPVEADTTYCRNTTSAELRKKLSERQKMLQERRIYVVLPPAGSHSGHTVAEVDYAHALQADDDDEEDHSTIEMNAVLQPPHWSSIWNAISDDQLKGWVYTLEDAERVRESFERHTGHTYVVEKRTKDFGQLKMQQVIQTDMKALKIRFKDIRDAVIPYDGVPFLVCGQYTRNCRFGRDRHKARKQREREREEERLRKSDNPNKKKRKRQISIKQGCQAKIEMKEIIRFQKFQCPPHSHHKRKNISLKIRDMWSAGIPLHIESRIYIRLPLKSEHQGSHVYEKKQTRARIMQAVTLESIEEAALRVKGHIHMTPVMTCGMLDSRAQGRKLFFKCELLQKTGSFKIRGALNAVMKLKESRPEEEIKVVTHSSGNFGQALAYAAKLNGIEAFIVMPTTAPLCKRNAVLGYGAGVVMCEPTEESREEFGKRVVEETGAHFFSPSQTYDVISGQGTIGLELLEQIPDLDAVVVPVGGGGMIAGIATAIKSKKPSIKVYAAEPANANDCFKSFHAKKFIPLPPGPVDTVADGLKVSIGKSTWPIIANYVDDVFTVTEEEIVNATCLVWQYMKQWIEPSAGVGVAVVMSENFSLLPPEIKNVAVILCGGNVDMDTVKSWL